MLGGWRSSHHPLGMRRGRIIHEAADLALLVIQQPADTLLGWVAIN